MLDYRDKKVTDFEVKLITRKDVRDFVETWHYSQSINGLRITYVFGLFCEGDLIGAMIYGPLGMANTWKKYGKEESDVIELRRLCCIDNTPKCTESYFIGKTQRWLKKNTNHKIIVSYADAYHNHTGIIYRATNFKYEGLTSKGRVIEYNGRTYHDKAIRTKYKGKLKPFAQRLKDALDIGDAKYIQTPGKHIYTFELIRK
tara:strand:+ start:103 stop:705 length:603 start_codon:yes stop_codon:yes gene_type:complete